MGARKQKDDAAADVVINEHGVITSGYETIDVPTGVKGISVTLRVAEYENLWYAAHDFNRAGHDAGSGGNASPLSVDVDNSYVSRDDAVDAMVQEAYAWMQHDIDVYPKGAWASRFKTAKKAMVAYLGLRFAVHDGWTCPECGRNNDANSGECDCGTTYDGDIETISGTIETRPDDSAPGEQESGETLEGEILPPVAVTTPYAPDKISEQYRRAVSGTLEVLRFGAMLIEVDTSLTRETRKGCIQAGETLKAWLDTNCPEVNYKTAMRFKMLAEDMQRFCQIPAKLPVSLALPGPDGAVHLEDLPANVNAERVGKIQQQVWEMVQGQSARQLMFQFRTDAAPRGGDHGGGLASHERSMTPNQFEKERAAEQWQLIVSMFREFALERKRELLVPPSSLEAGMKAIKDCIVHIETAIAKG